MNEGMVPFVHQRRLLDVSLSPVHSVKTPLRYPGGKSVLWAYVSGLIDTSGCGGTYVEPYAGGAGIALRLLAEGKVSGIVINDMDVNVHALWDAVVNDHARFMQLFDCVEPTIEQWHHWRAVLRDPVSELERGFAFFFLNRTCRSGVVTAGVIGGLAQKGRYRVDARYNKSALRDKLEFLGCNADRIEVRGVTAPTWCVIMRDVRVCSCMRTRRMWPRVRVCMPARSMRHGTGCWPMC